MDLKLKKTALKNLAQTAGELAESALQKEAQKITNTLQTETQYNHIAEQLELLGTIAYRVHEKAVEIIKNLLVRLETLELTYQEVPGFPMERLQEYQNNDSLIIKALEVLEHIRYHQPIEILDIFFQYSAHAHEEVAKQARHGIEELAGYDLDIFYSDGKDWPGLGWEPQEKILEKISSFSDAQKHSFFSGILTACIQMLSPTIDGTSWNYKSVTLRSGAVPAKEGIKDIRKKTLKVLESLYPIAETLEQKKAILSTMHCATHTPPNYGDDVFAMIMEDTLAVLQFMKTVVGDEDLQIKQQMEHDAYLFFQREGDQQVKDAALEVKAILDKDKEYNTFKTLIGFQGVFSEWSDKETAQDEYDYTKELRERKAIEFAASITEKNYSIWKVRILNYASIKSNDMMTFPYFGKFLENFGKSSPILALKLLSEASDELEGFLIPILFGISETEQKDNAYALINTWVDQGHYLFSLARFFEFSKEIEENLFRKIYETAKTKEDLNTLNQVIASVAAQYANNNQHLVKDFFIPALKVLTEHKNSNWVSIFWFRQQREKMLADMDLTEQQAVLNNLYWLNEIDYEAEEILCKIAEQSPLLVLQFFCNRLSKEKDDNRKYKAIPFTFHELSKPLSKIPEEAVDTVLATFDGNYGMFVYRGGSFLKNIFPDFPKPFEEKLIKIIQTREENNLLFVMAILRSYEGQPFIHNICKELIKILPDGGDLLNEVGIILQNTGVVWGEYGFVEAYKRKIEEIKPWLNDDNEEIQKFARNYILGLEQRIEYEQKRADEDIILNKHQYGDNEN